MRTFLPWFRTGYAAALDGPPPAGAARAPVPATVRLRGAGRVDVPLALAGPGDVAGLDPREILRCEPFDGCADFEPAYFPYLELASPDLPWRFTPEGPASSSLPGQPGTGTQQRVRPWLALVVVPAADATLSPADPGGVAVLRCNAADLPDPAESWAWAHVQVTHDGGQTLEQALAIAGSAVARLICPRRLDAGVQYFACLVPTFAVGRAALLPGPAGGDPLGPAWSGTGTTELPAYHHWSFRTGPQGSFESVVRRLQPRPLPAGTGGRLLATGAPGWGASAGSPTATVRMQGALRPVGTTEPDADDPVLAESLRAAVSATGTGLQLCAPLYGQDHQGNATAVPPGATGWLAELNTDPRRRVAAGLASFAVAVHQEQFADTAWRQLAADRPDGDRQLDRALADAVTGSLTDRHLSGTAPATAALARMLRPGGPLAVGAPSAPNAPLVPIRAEASTAPELFAPHFDVPAYTLLRAVAPEWLLPELSDLPTDSVALAQTNGAFVESFIVGLNHALARELAWRRFPVRLDGTFFDRFWGSANPGDTGALLPPIASWNPADRLGSHTGADDRLVLLVRGAMLRRFPTATIYLSRNDEHLKPDFTGRIGVDCGFFGFPITAAQAAEGGWLVIVQESVSHTRFGVDDAPANGTPEPLRSWQDLDWAHPHLTGRSHVPVTGPLSGVARPVAPGGASAVWGLDAANLAAALQQPSFRIRIPVALWLTPAQPVPA